MTQPLAVVQAPAPLSAPINAKVKPLPAGWSPATFLLTGISSSGKTQSWTDLALELFKLTGGKVKDGKVVPGSGLRTRLYCLSDNYEPALPFVEMGIIEVVDLRLVPGPLYWITRVAAGKRPVDVKVDAASGVITRGWQTQSFSDIGLTCFDSATGLSDGLMEELREKAGQGVNIGGDGAFKFDVGSVEAGGKETMGSSNMAHYVVAQGALLKFADLVNKLAVQEGMLVLVTATERRDVNDAAQRMFGPQLAGKALVTEWPRKFTYMARTSLESTPGKTELEHVLSFDSVVDLKAGGVMAIGNRRTTRMEGIVPPPQIYRPASLVKAYGDVVAHRLAVKQKAAEMFR